MLNFNALVPGDMPDGVEIPQEQIDALAQGLGGVVTRIGGDGQIVSLGVLGDEFGADSAAGIDECAHGGFPFGFRWVYYSGFWGICQWGGTKKEDPEATASGWVDYSAGV